MNMYPNIYAIYIYIYTHKYMQGKYMQVALNIEPLYHYRWYSFVHAKENRSSG